MAGQQGANVRQQIHVKLPCAGCVHQGVCLIEEQLEQDLTLRIGVEDARTHLVEGGPAQELELRIDCSWYDDRPIRPKGSGKLRRSRAQWTPERRSAASTRALTQLVEGRRNNAA